MMNQSPGPRVGPPPELLLQMRAISKSFGDVEVLSGVDFDLRAGEVHVLAGENGAGKSTLMKILAGVYDDYRGEILLRGAPRRFARPHHAYDAGIAVIYQELSLVDSLSIGENLLLGREEGGVLGWLDRKKETHLARQILAEAEIHADPDLPAEAYPIGTRQTVEIARALSRNASILVMDEPTSALTDPEVERLFRLIRSLTREGKGVVYITHKLEEIFRIGDRVTVLRDGETVATTPVAALNRCELVRQMVGREVLEPGGRASGAAGGVLLEVRNLTVRAPGEGRLLVDGVSFSVRKGEIVGLAGLQGCGNSEVLHAIFGACGEVSGSVVIAGAPDAVRAPSEAIRERVALLTNDRKRSGLVFERPVRENITLASLPKFSPAGWVLRAQENDAALRRRDQLQIRASSPEQEVGTLSGGNQQKVVFAKWLETSPALLLLDDPTRGVDVGAKAEIHALVASLREEGCGILLVSSETPELLSLSDRVLVMRSGRIVAEFDHATALQESVLAAALGSGEETHE
jgi:ABC-type sugar transport system ATPase subunit